MNELVSEGHYADYSELIEVAVSNLHVLHAQAEGEALLLDSRGHQVAPYSNARTPPYVKPGATPTPAAGTTTRPAFPDVFAGIPSRPRPDQLLSAPSRGAPCPGLRPDLWIFGQYNRFLPLKATLRALVRMYLEVGPVPLSRAAEEIARQAALLGDALQTRDRVAGAKRGPALATAFPSTDAGAEKGMMRYANQFVGACDRKGRLYGFPADFGLLTLACASGEVVVPTREGWDFACMSNPVLDGGPGEVHKLSEEEAEFLVRHAHAAVPVEVEAYLALIRAVTEGHNTPSSMDAALRRELPEDCADTLTDAFLSTQRAGAVSRMVDLNMLERLKRGVRVQYTITPQGTRYAQLLRGEG